MDFIREKGTKYFELLKLAVVAGNHKYTESNLSVAISTINQYSTYLNNQHRIVSLLLQMLLQKSIKLNIFSRLRPEVQKLLISKTKETIVTETRKKSQLANILKQFKKQNIPVIVLKGTAFAGV